MSRLPPLHLKALSKEQKTLYDELSATAEEAFGNKFGRVRVISICIHSQCCRFITKTKDGHLAGPFEIYMHEPLLAGAFQASVAGLSQLTGVVARQKEVAILTVGAHFQAAYELYAHTHVALSTTNLTNEEISQIKDNKKPMSFEKEDEMIYDLAQQLVARPGPLPSKLYQEAVDVFGIEGFKTLIHLIAFYASICILLNAFEVQIPAAKTE